MQQPPPTSTHIKYLSHEPKLQMFVLVFSQGTTQNRRRSVLPNMQKGTINAKKNQLKS